MTPSFKAQERTRTSSASSQQQLSNSQLKRGLSLKRTSSRSSATASPATGGAKVIQRLIHRLRPSPSPSSTSTSPKMTETATPSKTAVPQGDDGPPPTPTLDDIRPPVFESEEVNDLFYGSSSSSAGSSQERSRTGIKPLAVAGTLPRGFEMRRDAAAGAAGVTGRGLQKTRSSIQFGAMDALSASTSKTPGGLGALNSRRVLSASMAVSLPTDSGSAAAAGNNSSAGESSAEKGTVGIGIGWRGVKRGLGGSVVGASGRGSEASLDGAAGVGSSQEEDAPTAFKSPLSASTSSTARMPPLSRLTSSERVPSQNPSDLPPPSTLHRPLSTLTSSAVTPGFPGRERLGASMGHAGAGAIGLSESSKRFRSAFRLTKPIGAVGTAPRRAGRARPEDLVSLSAEEEEEPVSSSATENEGDADGEGESSAASPNLNEGESADFGPNGAGPGRQRQSSSPQALESAQLVPLSSQPSTGTATVRLGSRRPNGVLPGVGVAAGRGPQGRRPSELDAGLEADSEPSPPPLGLPPNPTVPVANGHSKRPNGKVSATQLDDLMLAPHSPPSQLPLLSSSTSSTTMVAPEEDVENQFGRSVSQGQAARTRPGRAPLAAKESVESLVGGANGGVPARIGHAGRRPSFNTATAMGDDTYQAHPPQGRSSPRMNGAHNLGSSRNGYGGSSPIYADQPHVNGGGGSGERGGGATLRATRERNGSQATQIGRAAGMQVARDGQQDQQPSPPQQSLRQSQQQGRRPLAEISRAAHYNARSQEAVVGEYQVPLQKESPPTAQGWQAPPKPSSHHQSQQQYARPPGSAPPASGMVSAPTIVQPEAPPPAKTKSSRNYSTVNGVTYARAGLLGKGGSSKVWRVLDNKNSIYALKVVTLSKGDHETYFSFVNEIKLLEQLKGHDRVIRLIDSEVDEVNKRLSLVMEIGDVDLNTLLTEQLGKAISMNFLRHIWEQMLQAVQVVHDADIVHTDLKPANFVLVKGNLKLIDFGIAKAIPNDTTNIARDSQIGTANYMSPEALSDSGLGQHGRLMKMGRATDVWALGCILYQMVYGHTPYSKIRPMHVKIMAIQNPGHVIDYPSFAVPINERGEPQEHLKVAVRNDLVNVMKGCLRFDPKKRMTIPDLLQDPFLTGAPSVAAAEDDGMPHLSPALMSSMVSRVLQWSAGRAAPPTKEQQDHFVENLYHAILASQ